MRKLMWFSIGFAAACALCVYVLPMLYAVLLGAMFLCGGISLILLSEKISIRICAAVCFGLAVGMAWCGIYDTLRLAPIRAMDEKTCVLTVTAEDYSFSTDYGICVDGTTEIDGQSCRIRAYVNQQTVLAPGDRITCKFRLRYTAPGAAEDMTYHSGKGILLLAYPKGVPTITRSSEKAARYFAAYLRRDIQQVIGDAFPEDTEPFVLALLLGDTSQLDYKTETDLAASGLRHVAAVSGLHVAMLFSLLYLFTGRRGIPSLLLGVPVLFVFAAVAGFSPSVTRAAIMQALILLGAAVNKEYDGPIAISFAVLVMLALNPLTVTSAGFQLSVASVSGVLMFSEKIRAWIMSLVHIPKKKKRSFPARLYGKLATSVSTSVSALVFTTPLTVWYFGTVSILSMVANLLCLWVITILFCGIAATCLVGWIWLPAAKVLGWLFSWLVRYVLGIASCVAQFPFAAVYTESLFILLWVIVSYGLIALWVIRKKKRPMLLAGCIVILLCAALLLSWGLPQLDSYRVTVLDVGQGQCILLQSGGKTYMVDCGGSYDEDAADIAAETLLSQGIRRLDGLILTHYDKDHVGGAQYLLQRIFADVLILPEGDKDQRWDPKLLAAHEGTTLRATEDIFLRWDGGELRIFSSWTTETSNESSMCVLFHTEKCDILITGDRSSVGEEILLLMEDIPQLDALIVGHHGSEKSTSETLLAATRPKLALISVGEDNSYDHPAAEVLERLNAYGCIIRRTDLEGTIIIRG